MYDAAGVSQTVVQKPEPFRYNAQYLFCEESRYGLLLYPAPTLSNASPVVSDILEQPMVSLGVLSRRILNHGLSFRVGSSK